MDVTDVYNTQADTISVDTITSNSNNRIVLRRLRRNEASVDDDDNENIELYIQNQHDNDGERCVDYVPGGAFDMGWLGYFVGENEHLKNLYMRPFTPTSGSSVRDVLVPFFRGVSSNKSIRKVYLYQTDLLRGEVFTMLGSFFQNNYNLTNINIENCDFGDEGSRLFALAIGSSIHKSLRRVELEDNNIAEEGMVDIITALSMHPHLEYLDLEGNHLRENGCVALATLLRYSAKALQYLYLSNTDINDDGIEALVTTLANCNHLEELLLSENPSITTRGWQSFATILEAPNSNLEVLGLRRNNIDDEAVAAFANALVNNRTLHSLGMTNNPITAVGWEALSKLLCNSSSVSSTFLSSHTLLNMGGVTNENEIIGPLLHLNQRYDKKEVATIKILQSHDDFDMLPFFEWEFKVLPLVLSWLERASEYEMPNDFEPNIDRRKLSTMYQFVRGLPLLYVETRLRKELEDIKAEEKQMEEEQQKLDQEFEQRKQYLQERKELLGERKKSIMRKIGKTHTSTEDI